METLVPPDKLVAEQVATPAGLTDMGVPQPKIAFPLSLNVTVPAGKKATVTVPVTGATVAVSVTGWSTVEVGTAASWVVVAA